MINLIEEIGNCILKSDLAKNFQETFKNTYPPAPDFGPTSEFFMAQNSSQLQFEGFLMSFSLFEDEIQKESAEKYDKVGFFVNECCLPLTILSNNILFLLNNYIYNDEIFEIIDIPFSELFDNYGFDYIKNEEQIKNSFEVMINNYDDVLPLILKLRDKFFKSKLFESYFKSLKNDENLEVPEMKIKAFFYIIREIIYQTIRDNNLPSITKEDNIINLKSSEPINEPKTYNIKYQPSSNAKMSNIGVARINYEEIDDLVLITQKTFKHKGEKGEIIDMKAEKLLKEGLHKNSPSNNVLADIFKRVECYQIIIPSQL